MNSGISRLMHAAAFLENRLGLETLKIAHEGLAAKDCWFMETADRHLLYNIVIDGGFIFFSVQGLDSGQPLESLLTIGETVPGWRTVCSLITSLENSGLKSLDKRPIELGEIGSNEGSFVIS